MTLNDLITRCNEIAQKYPDALDKRVVVYPVDGCLSVNVRKATPAMRGHSRVTEFTLLELEPNEPAIQQKLDLVQYLMQHEHMSYEDAIECNQMKEAYINKVSINRPAGHNS